MYTGDVDIRIWEPSTNQLILESTVFIQVTSSEDREASSAEFEFQIPDSMVVISFNLFQLKLMERPQSAESFADLRPSAWTDRLGSKSKCVELFKLCRLI